MRISRRHFLLGAAAVLPGAAQEPRFSADVNVVTLVATVRDRDGRIVKDLNREDFVLKEDGAPPTIRYFSRESGLPLTVGLLVDTSRSQTGVIEQERTFFGRRKPTFGRSTSPAHERRRSGFARGDPHVQQRRDDRASYPGN